MSPIGAHAPSPAGQASFAGLAGELVVSGELDPASTPVLPDMLSGAGQPAHWCSA